MIINAFSLHDLLGFAVTASLAVIFYTVYWAMGRHRIYLLFANLIALASLGCLFTFLADNAVPQGVPAAALPESEHQFLFWLRCVYLVATLCLPVLSHFVIRYCRLERLRTLHIGLIYGACLPLAAMVWSPAFFSPRGEPVCPTSGWSCTVPWWPHLGPGFYLYVGIWAAVNIWAQRALYRYARGASLRADSPLPRIRLVQVGILIPLAAALIEMVAVMFGYAGIAFFPITASVMGLLISTALVLDGVDRHKWSRRLEEANRALQAEIAERERVERERASLDAKLEHLRYLYRLRTALSSARSTEEVAQATGQAVLQVLSGSGPAGVLLEIGGRRWEFGDRGAGDDDRFERELAWGDRARGRLQIFSPVALHEAQERVLVDETAGQLVRILEARELETQLTQSARLVALGQLAAGVAHELSQPLSAMCVTIGDLWLRLIEGADLPPARLKEMVRDTRHLLDRMGDTVEHLRVFSRDTSQQPGELFCVNEALLSSLKLLRTQFENHGIALNLELTEPLPEIVGHPRRLEQVFLNLLSNARDSLDDRAQRIAGNGSNERWWRPELTIRTGEERDGPRWVVATVEDNGEGMDAASCQRAFDPFFTTKPEDRGTGLGLSIAHAIVDDHGGRITCESRPGAGALFRVALPVDRGMT